MICQISPRGNLCEVSNPRRAVFTKKFFKIEEKRTEISEQKENVGAILKSLYWSDQKSLLEILLTNDSLSDFFNGSSIINDPDAVGYSVIGRKVILRITGNNLLNRVIDEL